VSLLWCCGHVRGSVYTTAFERTVDLTDRYECNELLLLDILPDLLDESLLIRCAQRAVAFRIY
jgi:hypothetical protein